MTDDKGPITLITDISHQRNRWKALAFAWRSAAVSAIRPCSVCGAPSMWHDPEQDVFWCAVHHDDALPKGETEKTRWAAGLRRALELEIELEQDSEG